MYRRQTVRPWVYSRAAPLLTAQDFISPRIRLAGYFAGAVFHNVCCSKSSTPRWDALAKKQKMEGLDLSQHEEEGYIFS